MRKIQKHQFEPVSLLTVENGVLQLAVLPAVGQPDWLVPKSLVLAVIEFAERIWTYLPSDGGFGQEISVYHLVPKSMPPTHLVVLEGNTEVHRLGLQTVGAPRDLSVRISDVKDAPISADLPDAQAIYQAVVIEGVVYSVPDLDLIAHNLVDLDS